MQTGFMQCHSSDAQAIRDELGAGLLAPRAHTSPKYLYDALGSKLFESICELDEYYPTRTEAAIYKVHLDSIARSLGKSLTLIDLGAGNCAKAARLFPLVQPAQYVPVDISVDHLRDAVMLLRQRFPQLAILGLGLDFSESFELPEGVLRERRVFFYAGSSIGNFTPQQAEAFLRRLRAQCDGDGGLLIGVDLIKDRATLDRAYDDALGVTAAFNLNLLRHLNVLLGTDFDVRDWRHRGFFNDAESRIEMHLEARRAVEVRWPGARRRFAEGDTIHTENSYKYQPQAFLDMLLRAGFGEARLWTDAHEWFAVVHARALS
jgi:dimethylhistidine N-methyltransferase